MESLSKNPCAQEGTTASRTASAWEIKEEFIGQRMKAWLATERSMPLHECLSKFWVMSTDPNVAPEVENGIAVSSEHGYKYISFSDDPGSDPRLRRRSEMLEKWSANPANKRILVEIEGLMVQEIRDKLWWLRQDEHDDPLKMGVLEKVKQYAQICAEGRLMDSMAVDPHGPGDVADNHHCRLCICKVDKLGTMSMEWANLPWLASLEDFLHQVKDTPTLEVADALSWLLGRLESLEANDTVADRVRATKNAAETQLGLVDEMAWACSLCDKEVPSVSGQTWTRITSEEDLRNILKAAREGNKLLVCIRPWQERVYTFSYEISQLEHCSVAEAEAEGG